MIIEEHFMEVQNFQFNMIGDPLPLWADPIHTYFLIVYDNKKTAIRQIDIRGWFKWDRSPQPDFYMANYLPQMIFYKEDFIELQFNPEKVEFKDLGKYLEIRTLTHDTTFVLKIEKDNQLFWSNLATGICILFDEIIRPIQLKYICAKMNYTPSEIHCSSFIIRINERYKKQFAYTKECASGLHKYDTNIEQ